MENYIVRIYRRDPNDTEKVKGSLESIENETQQPFESWRDLRAALASAGGDVVRGGKGRRDPM